LELIEIAEAEIDAAVQEAFAEGYKAAMLEYAPDAAVYKLEAEIMQTELKRERKKNRLFLPVTGLTAGVSFVAGILLHSLVTR
jgi:hypothetical protein